MLTSCGRTQPEEPAGRAHGTFQEQHLTQSTDKVALRTAEVFVAQLSISVWSKGNFLKQPVCLPPRSLGSTALQSLLSGDRPPARSLHAGVIPGAAH